MTRPDGWSRNPNGTWAPPAPAQIQKQWEVPADVALTTIRDKAVEVRNADAEVVVRMGRLADGSYGLELLEGGLTINQLSGTTLVVKDNEGDTRVIVGEHEGDFDVKIFDESGENPVKLSTLAFGIQAATVATSEGGAIGNNYTDLSTVGPSVTLEIGPSGRAIVTVSALVQFDDENAGAFASFAVSGATTQAATDARAVSAFMNLAAHAPLFSTRLSKVSLVENLTPGSNTFTMKYRGTGVTDTPFFEDRTITIQPF